MIGYITGNLTFKSPAYVLLECNGIGYQVYVSLHTFSRIREQEKCRLLTYLHVTESAHTLYGFYDELEKMLFTQLISDARAAEWEYVKQHETDRLFYRLAWWKKVIVMAGGPMVNIAIAFFLFWGVFATVGQMVDAKAEPVVAEVVLAMIVLSGAGLLVRSFLALRAVDPGYDAAGLVSMRITLPGDASLERRESFFRQLDERIEALPGVRGASYTTNLPAVEGGPGAWVNLLDRPAPATEPPSVEYRAMGPDFPAVAGIPLVRGRLPDPSSSRVRTPEVLIDEVVARRFWPDGDPIGRELTLGPDGGWIPPSRIVGVVAATQDERLGGGTPGVVYVPHALVPWWSGMAVVIRTDRPLSAIAPELRIQVAALDPALPVTELARVRDLVAGSITTERSTTLLLSLMAALALLLAAVGLFGVLSYAVGLRARELGIRAALGADPGRMRLMVLGQGVALVLAGVVPGAVVGLTLSGAVDQMLFQVRGTDPAAYAGAGLLLLLTGMAASWGPARRATRVDPAEALRSD